MITISRVPALAALVALNVVSSMAPARAGQLFPPVGLTDPHQSCPIGQALSWVGGDNPTIQCVGISTATACPAGTTLSGISSGNPVCIVTAWQPVFANNQAGTVEFGSIVDLETSVFYGADIKIVISNNFAGVAVSSLVPQSINCNKIRFSPDGKVGTCYADMSADDASLGNPSDDGSMRNLLGAGVIHTDGTEGWTVIQDWSQDKALGLSTGKQRMGTNKIETWYARNYYIPTATTTTGGSTAGAGAGAGTGNAGADHGN